MSRKLKNIILPKRILILCEGESEKIYLKGLKKEKINKNCSIEIEMYQPHDFSPLGIVKEAKKKIIEANRNYKYSSVWVVFDKDGHANINSAFDLAYTNRTLINIAFSNICFEYWIFLHFEQKKKYFRSCDEIVSYLKHKHKIDYSKTMNIYEAIKDKTA